MTNKRMGNGKDNCDSFGGAVRKHRSDFAWE
jgi:hypothetical protein